MNYRGYVGSVHYNEEDEIFYGRVEYIRSLISFEGYDVKSLKQAFHESVDDYLETCIQQNCRPEIPFKGSFNVRVGSSLHRKTMEYALAHDMNINSLTKQALEQYING